MDILLNVLKWSAAAGAATALVLALKPVLDRRYSPRWRYWLWLALAAMLLMSPVRLGELIPALPEPAVELSVPRVEVPVSRPNRPEAVPAAPATPTAPEQSPAVLPAVPVPGPLPAAEPEARAVPLGTVLTVLWLTGAGVFALWYGTATCLFARRARRRSAPADPEMAELCREIAGELGLRHPPEVLICRDIASPMALGLLRPRVLLPRVGYGERELGFILHHELGHIRRRDLWYKVLVLAANGLHWFNPLIWLLRREAGETVELLCDEDVVKNAPREDREAYCETILRGLRRERGARAALSTHFYGGVRSVKNRFKNLLGGRNRRMGWAALLAALLLVTVAACAVGVSGRDGWTADLTLYDPDARLGEGFTVEVTGLSSDSPEVSATGGFSWLTEFTVTPEGLSFTAPRFTPGQGEGWIGLLWNAVLKDPFTGEDLAEAADPLRNYLRVWLDSQEREAELFDILEAGDGYAYHVRFREPLTEEEAESGTLFVACGSDEWLETHYPGWKPVRELWSVDLTDDRVYDPVPPGFGADVTWTDGEPSVVHLGYGFMAADFTLNESGVTFTLYGDAPELVLDGVLPIREYAVYDYRRDNTRDDRRENTPELRVALEKRFAVTLDGVTVPGELVVTGGSDRTDLAYVFDTPLAEPRDGTVHIAVGAEDWVASTRSDTAPDDAELAAEWGFTIRATGLASDAPALTGEGTFDQLADVRVTGQEVSFSLDPSRVRAAALQALRELAVYDPARDGDGASRRENTPELREALSRRFMVLVNGGPVSGELVVGQGNGHLDFTFRLDDPISDSILETAEVYAAVGDPLWVADHGLVYRWNNPYYFTDHCQVYPAAGAHIYYHSQAGVMHGGQQDLLVVWADGSRTEYLSQLPPLEEYEFSTSYYAQDITVSDDGLSFTFFAPDYRVAGEGNDKALEDRGLVRYRVDLVTGQMERVLTLADTELERWTAQLNAPEWNGFVSHYYASPRELDLCDLMYLGGGIGRVLTTEEAEQYGVTEVPTMAFDRDVLDEWLREHTGVGLEEIGQGLDQFDTLPGHPGTLYLAHGDTNYTAVTVTAGVWSGDTLTLTVEHTSREGYYGTLTVRDGKFVSFTADE